MSPLAQETISAIFEAPSVVRRSLKRKVVV